MLLLTMAIPAIAASEQPTASPAWKLATEDTEVILSIKGGWPVLEALKSTAARRNWLMSPLRESLMQTVEIDGVSRDLNWKFENADLDAKGGQLVLHYRNAMPRLSLDSVWRARPGHGPIEHWSALTNESGHAITVLHSESLALSGLTIPSTKPVQAWWIKRGGGNASTEGGTFHIEVNSSFDQVLTSDPTDGSSPVPWMAIQAGETDGLYVGWEFSGIGGIHARATNPNQFELHAGLASDFKTDVPDGSTFLIPPAFIGCYRGDLDDGSYTLHRFILEKLLPPLPPNQPYPTLAYNLYLDVGGNKAREQDVLSSAKLCKKLGFETFVPDAMWFPKDGDWRWDPARFPRGGQPIEEYAHQNGMKLGLWVAWTHGGDSLDPGALNVFQHPDWFTEKVNPGWEAKDLNWSTLIDLGFDPALDFAVGEVERVVEQNHLDYLKHDYSPIVTQCVQSSHRHHYGVDVSYWSTLGYYQIMETVKQRHPNLVLEGCSGGGHIKDFGYIKHVHYLVTTDTLSALPDRQSIYDSTFAFPPAVLMAYTYENFYNHDADQPGPYLWRSAMMGAWQIDPTHSADWSPEEIASAQRATEIYKSWIRPMLKDVEVHHILPRPDGLHWDGMFYWSPSLKRGTVYVFRPNNDQATQEVRLPGLAPEGQFHVRSEEGSVPEQVRPGSELMTGGLRVKLPNRYSSDLIYIERNK
jgi:alpha-galactosidase